MVLMRVRHQDRLDLAVADCFEIRQRILPGVFRVHSAIEQEPMPGNLKVVRIGADLGVPGEISEFQNVAPMTFGGFLSECLLSEQSVSRWV